VGGPAVADAGDPEEESDELTSGIEGAECQSPDFLHHLQHRRSDQFAKVVSPGVALQPDALQQLVFGEERPDVGCRTRVPRGRLSVRASVEWHKPFVEPSQVSPR